MLRLLKLLIWGDWHMHKWVPYGNVTKMYMDGDPVELPSRRQQSFQCETCGTVKIFTV